MLRGKTWVVHFRFSGVAKNHEAIYMELRGCDPNSSKAGRLKHKIQQTPARQTDAINGCCLSAAEGTGGGRRKEDQNGRRKVESCRLSAGTTTPKDNLREGQKALKTKGKYGAEDRKYI